MTTAPVETEQARERAVRRVLLVVLGLNLAVAAAKAAYGLHSGLLAVASDAAHSALDAGSTVLAILVLRFAARPPDPEHPYGHHKIEILAAAGIGALIALAALRFGWAAVEALLGRRSSAAPGAGGFVVIGLTLAVNVVITTYEHRRGRALGSALLQADAAHTGSDVLVTLSVLGSMLAGHLGVRWADPVGALLVLAVMLRVAWQLLSTNLNVLLDRAALEPALVRDLVLGVPGVRSCHRIRSRGVSGALLLDLHVLVDGELTVTEAHAIAHAVEDRLRAELPAVRDVTVHIEPYPDPEEPL